MDHMIVAFIGMPGQTEMIIVLIIAVLLFGKRLPEVGRSLGKGIIEFKKGIRGVEDDMDDAVNAPPEVQAQRPAAEDEREEVVAPKFEPPKSEPAESAVVSD